MLRARNGAGNRIAPRGGEFPFSLPADRMLAGCPRVTVFPALRELVSRAPQPTRRHVGVALPAPQGAIRTTTSQGWA